MELKTMAKIDKKMGFSRQDSIKLSLGTLFVLVIMLMMILLQDHASPVVLVVAAMIGGYMAMNIGANDVANNVGPAVGSGAVTLMGAIIIAAIFESAGALIAGGDVVSTIKKGIIDPALIADSDTFVWLMLAALLAAALWLNFATFVGAPVSTTHSIVGGVMGGGIAAAGFEIVNWPTMGKIAASWVISPLLGGLIAAFFLYIIKTQIIYKSDMTKAAKRLVPYLIALMVAAFVTYLTLKGLKHIWPDIVSVLSFLPESKKPSFGVALGFGAVAAVISYFFINKSIAKTAQGLENSRESINMLFTIPLIFAAALLSFAHGANDVANAVGPLAAINDALGSGAIAAKASIPLWVMLIGALGISVGLALYGPKLIRTVGSEITELDRMRAFSIAMAAAITVIIASQLKLPVSSTHIAVGGVFGVGLLREWLIRRNIEDAHTDSLYMMKHEHEDLDAFIKRFKSSSKEEQEQMLKEVKSKKSPLNRELKLSKAERKQLRRLFKQVLVKRAAINKIVAAWIITVPASALLAAMLFYMIRGILHP